jgi:hypothetical protein
VTQKEKTEYRLVSGIDCNPQTAAQEMRATKVMWDKEEGKQYKHFVQSFPPDEKITPQQAHQMAQDLCKDRFPGHEVLIATHQDREHIHSHIIVNSVNHENGKKLRWSKADLVHMKARNDEICREQGLSIPVKGDRVQAYEMSKYKAIERAAAGEYKGYVAECYKAATVARSAASSREDFITRMQAQGWETKWQENVKHITFTDRDGNKVRAANLEKTFQEDFTKEGLIREFEGRTQEPDIRAKAAAALQQARGRGADRGADGADQGFDLDNIRQGIDDSRAAINADDAARAERLDDRESQQREQDREFEREIKRASRRSPGIER